MHGWVGVEVGRGAWLGRGEGGQGWRWAGMKVGRG